MPHMSATTTGAPDPRIIDITRRYWGYATLRPLQHEAMLAGIAARDSLVVLPTGGGKSLCYQVPPVAAQRTDVVVSPLISLMKDQVDGLRACGYPAVALHSQSSRSEQIETQRAAVSGECRLLFVSPEKLLTPVGLNLVRQARVRAFAIDEAHCISHWGHDFRPEYRRLAELREHFPDASLHAYTATATPRVREDIVAQLRLREPAVLVGVFDRPNLVYRVVQRQGGMDQVLDAIRRHAGEAVIVYCITRRDTEELAAFLRGERIRAAHYHAGLEAGTRRKTQDDFAAERLDVVVATVAFGMGIDRSNVRAVIHAAMPKSVEHYQQEAGRAGRDGLPAECVLLYSVADAIRWEGLIARSAAETDDPEAAQISLELLSHVRRYATRIECRHRLLSEYFGQSLPQPSCGACDVCLGEIPDAVDVSVEAQKILSCVARVGERFGVGHVVDVLTGKLSPRVRSLGHDRLSTFAILKESDKKALTQRVYQLLDQGLLSREGGEYPVLRLNAASWEVLRGQRAVRAVPASAAVRRAVVEEEAWEGVDQELFEALRRLRKQIAEERVVPPFIILNDATLRELARIRPGTIAAFGGVGGIGQRKTQDFGQRFVDAIVAQCRARGLPTDQAPARAPTRPRFDDQPRRPPRTALLAFERFDEGAAIEEVMAELGRARATVVQYLAHWIGERRPPTIERWVRAGTYDRVAAAVREVGDAFLGPVREHIVAGSGEEIAYDDIRLVIAHLSATNPRGAAPGDTPATSTGGEQGRAATASE